MEVILLGLESSGKSTFISRMKDEPLVTSNVRGSTKDFSSFDSAGYTITDAPGFRIGETLDVHQMLKTYTERCGEIWLFVRGPHIQQELSALVKLLKQHALTQKHFRLFVSFKDKMTAKEAAAVHQFTSVLPVTTMDLVHDKPVIPTGDAMTFKELELLLSKLPDDRAAKQLPLWFRMPTAILLLLMLFAVPVFMAFQVSSVLDGMYDTYIMPSIESWSAALPSALQTLLTGHYGILSIGIFSIIWALPVVLLFTFFVELSNDIGIKDYITDALDPAMRRIGLTGADLLPVINGFGCNVVALNETKTCFTCTKKQCISVISFGSACSYQIGATLSVLSMNHHMHLLVPYILLLVTGTIIYAKLFKPKAEIPVLTPRQVYFKAPRLSAVMNRALPSYKMFFTQALPIFFLICLVASVLEMAGVITLLGQILGPVLHAVGLEAAYAPALLASMIRKDGILLLNTEIPHASQAGDLSILIILLLCSTLTPCLVTMMKIRQEIGMKSAATLLIRQAATTVLLVALLLALKTLI